MRLLLVSSLVAGVWLCFVTDCDGQFIKDPEAKEERLEDQLEESVAEDERTRRSPVLPNVRFWPNSSCCERGYTIVNLRNGASCAVINTNDAVEVIVTPESTNKVKECSKTAVLKVNFQRLTGEPCDFCLEAPYCGRRMLRIDLELSGSQYSGWLFNIGDSATNNGYAGDSVTQIRDAEADGKYPNVNLYESDTCGSQLLQTISNVLADDVTHVTLFISNEHIRVTNNRGLDVSVCSTCLYALNGQSDRQGINEDIYIGLNRVIKSTYGRTGVGVCSATLTWTCPVY